MSVVKRIVKDGIERVKVDELLADEYEQAGYGGITLTKTPLGTQINLFAMRPGRVIGKRGRAIKDASERLEQELGIPNPQITVVEVEFPELSPRIMAARIANALERGVHYRRAIFWSLNRIMEAGAIGCEIVLNGPLRSNRGRFEKVSEGYVPKAGDPALTYVKTATMHVKMKKGVIGVNVTIVPPDAKFPDKVDLGGLPVIEYPEEEYELPEGVEPEPPETPEMGEVPVAEETPTEETVEGPESIKESEIEELELEEPEVEASSEEEKPAQGEIQPPKQVKAKAETVEGEENTESAEPDEGDEEAEEEEEG
jgi:small subunit ribosomal protein S3